MFRRSHILAIDDDPMSLTLLEEYLADDYDVFAVSSARAGLTYLEAGHKVDAIVLDRMMPEMDGLAFMTETKSRALFRNIPVIMQSAAVTQTEITEGIASGVFYYLTKPFNRTSLLAVLSNAFRIYGVYGEVATELSSLQRSMLHIKTCDLTIRAFEEVNEISVLVSRFYPVPASVALGVRELVLNAVEHGNAGISYVEKTALHRSGTWERELSRRLQLPENRDKTVEISFRRMPEEIVLTIEDGGPGFDWRRYLALDPLRITDNHGRGIALSLLTSFDRIQYVAPGNKVVCTKVIDCSSAP